MSRFEPPAEPPGHSDPRKPVQAVLGASSGQETVSPRRVLVTGSRTWVDVEVIRTALWRVARRWGPSTVLVSGHCPRGADMLAETCWSCWGGAIELHPADWQRHGRSAGHRRNTEMVAAGADLCLAFIRNGSAGATGCARQAEAAGILVERYEQFTSDHPDGLYVIYRSDFTAGFTLDKGVVTKCAPILRDRMKAKPAYWRSVAVRVAS